MIKKNLFSKVQTVNFLKLISKKLHSGDIIYFCGDFGVGKTFSASVIIKELTGKKIVTSPTFNLVKTYFVNNNLEIWHCDFYRLTDYQEIEELGVFDNLNQKIILIEWPKFENLFNVKPLVININFGKKLNEREFYLQLTEAWKKRINFSN